jgi:NitT/TauT family transport system permease protein
MSITGFNKELAVGLSAALLLLAFVFPPAVDTSWTQIANARFGMAMLAGVLILSMIRSTGQAIVIVAQLLLFLSALRVAIEIVHLDAISGQAQPGLWFWVAALGFAAWHVMKRLSSQKNDGTAFVAACRILVPILLGVWLLALWELITIGFGIPRVLLPAPSLVGQAIGESLSVLAADFQQTVIRAVIPGFLLGNLAGFGAALAADRWQFLGRGLLPVGNLVSAIPIIGIAPIMVMWFGFDWQSKAAVVVIMTFFPMLVNTISGLKSSTAIELDLMRAVGASHWQSFTRVRLPNALPFVFNALKINSALALIGAIVAEFFGTPIVGMGFRISTEVGRMNMEMVWASIAVAAVSGSVFYGLLAIAERRATFWHASFRRSP